MDILEQPLEAVAFRIHSLPEVAAAWTWLAAALAAAAAAGVWRLRSSTAPSAVITDDVSKPFVELDTSPSMMVSPETERSLGRSSEPTSSSPPPALSPRERYTAYYHDSACVGCCDVYSDDEEEEEEEDRDQKDDDGVYGPAEADPFEWEVVRSLPLAATTATETWRYKSPRALSGSVVRLWDQGADRRFMTAAASRRRSSGRAGAASSF